MPIEVITEDDFEPMPASEAAKHFESRAAVSNEEFDRLSKAAKEKAFRILNVNKARLIQAARDTIKRAIESGSDYGETIRAISDMLAAEGEAGPSIARLRQTFLHHAHRAYADAQWKSLNDPDVVEAFPFLMYRSLGDTSVRATHAALDGLVFRRDDPFWDRFRPPWEYGCRCYVDPVSAEEVEAKGIKLANDEYVRKQLQVGDGQRGIQPNPDFNLEGLEFDLSALDEELRQAVERTNG